MESLSQLDIVRDCQQDNYGEDGDEAGNDVQMQTEDLMDNGYGLNISFYNLILVLK